MPDSGPSAHAALAIFGLLVKTPRAFTPDCWRDRGIAKRDNEALAHPPVRPPTCPLATSMPTPSLSPISATLQSLRRAPFALDDAAIAWVQQTLSQLSTGQKLRQLFNVAPHGEGATDVARVAALGVGGVTRFVGLNFERSWAVARELIDASTIPLLLSGDIEGGAIAMPFGTALPNQLGLAATRAAGHAPSGAATIATGLAGRPSMCSPPRPARSVTTGLSPRCWTSMPPTAAPSSPHGLTARLTPPVACPMPVIDLMPG